jgi:hypothetical protein
VKIGVGVPMSYRHKRAATGKTRQRTQKQQLEPKQAIQSLATLTIYFNIPGSTADNNIGNRRIEQFRITVR